MSNRLDGKKVVVNGFCSFYSEQETEGGRWAVQDSRFISKVLPDDGGIWGDQKVWDAEDPSRQGKTRYDAEVFQNGAWRPLPDPMQRDPDYYVSSLFQGEKRGDKKADRRLMERYGFVIKYVEQRMDELYGAGNWRLEGASAVIAIDGTGAVYGGVPPTEPSRPYGVTPGSLTRVTVEWEDGRIEQRFSGSLLVSSWSRQGLHILKDGDYLVVHEKDGSTNILWEGAIRLHKHNPYTESVFEYWIHTDQEGVKRETWARWFFEKCPATLFVA